MKRVTQAYLKLEHLDACFFEDTLQPWPWEPETKVLKAQVRARVSFPHISAGRTKRGEFRSQRLSCDLHAHTLVRRTQNEGFKLDETGGRGFWDVQTVMNRNPNPTTMLHRANVGWQTALREAVHQMFEHTAQDKVMDTEKLHWLNLGYGQVLSTALVGAFSTLMGFRWIKQVPTIGKQ